MTTRFLTFAALLLAATPLGAQQARTFAYGAGAAATAGRGLHIAASLEESSPAGGFGRRLDVMLHDRASRDVFVLANLLYRAPAALFSPYALAGVGAFSGEEVPLAANVGVGMESSRLLVAPVFLEARLLYTSEVYARTRLGIKEKELFPSVTLGVRLPAR